MLEKWWKGRCAPTWLPSTHNHAAHPGENCNPPTHTQSFSHTYRPGYRCMYGGLYLETHEQRGVTEGPSMVAQMWSPSVLLAIPTWWRPRAFAESIPPEESWLQLGFPFQKEGASSFFAQGPNYNPSLPSFCLRLDRNYWAD